MVDRRAVEAGRPQDGFGGPHPIALRFPRQRLVLNRDLCKYEQLF